MTTATYRDEPDMTDAIERLERCIQDIRECRTMLAAIGGDER